ncbi:hypothetical protein AAG570_004713 [Ranatra chinensis]|uniref:FYVE-type domain-containing protein n=1 Tax=Ranatra chinensis TaxID=642074 RepID=A0ABD0Y2D8_9HEMI
MRAQFDIPVSFEAPPKEDPPCYGLIEVPEIPKIRAKDGPASFEIPEPPHVEIPAKDELISFKVSDVPDPNAERVHFEEFQKVEVPSDIRAGDEPEVLVPELSTVQASEVPKIWAGNLEPVQLRSAGLPEVGIVEVEEERLGGVADLSKREQEKREEPARFEVAEVLAYGGKGPVNTVSLEEVPVPPGGIRGSESEAEVPLHSRESIQDEPIRFGSIEVSETELESYLSTLEEDSEPLPIEEPAQPESKLEPENKASEQGSIEDQPSTDNTQEAEHPEAKPDIPEPPDIPDYRPAENIDTENEEIENSQNEERANNVLNRPETPSDGSGGGSVGAGGEEAASGGGDCGSGEAAAGEKPLRPNTLPLTSSHVVTDSEESPTPTGTQGIAISPEERNLGKVAPFWVPDADADNCMQCQNKFTVIKRRHHCRACGLVLCSKCCSLRTPLEYMDFQEARVCQPCYNIIYKVSMDEGRFSLGRQPNPNNPMEYCSTIPPLQQAATALLQPPPSVLVPTGVLKREGRAKSDVPKQVMFSDGIRPGGDLTELDGAPESRLPPRRGVRRLATPPVSGGKGANSFTRRPLNPTTQSFIPNDLQLPPPVVVIQHGQLIFCDDVPSIGEEVVKYAINYNLFVNVKRVKLDCCVNRECWSVCSEGLACMGQDEVALVLECLPDETLPPQDVFHLVNTLHQDAAKGTSVNEMCFTPSFSPNLFGSKDHGGFLYIRPTLQCTTQLLLPSQPYLFAILVHRWEVPWARLFPLRLILRLGAEYRYYPTPLVSIRNRSPLYTDIGRTIMKILVDFRKYSYSLATVRGLLIHMEDRQTTILFPRNRYDQVVRALNNSNDSVLAFGANLSLTADSHLVCIQSMQDENTYHTQAINIHNKPRRVTGASFVVFNGALKVAGLSGKSSITEDGLMVHLPSDSMLQLRTALRDMKDYTVSCGPNDEETVLLKWTEDDTNFNVGVKSCIDDRPLDGVPSIRVHNGTDFPGNQRIIRWTEVFILQCEENSKATEPWDISKVSESLAHATCYALAPMLDQLAESNLTTLAVRATIHPENVGYEAGSCGERLPSHYMRRLDDELIQVVNQAAITAQDSTAVLELIFRIMNHP